MMKRTRALLACGLAVLSVAACAKPDCTGYKSLNAAKVLNDIGAGQANRLRECGVSADVALTFNGEPITPLQFAATLGKPDVVRQVLKAGANPNHAGEGEVKLPPLELALSNKHYEAADVLLGAGARADYALAPTGATALMTLAFNDDTQGSQAIAARLVAAGARPNATDAKGNTALHRAARRGNADFANTLLTLGASACIKNQRSELPADLVPAEHATLKARLSNACATNQNRENQ